MLELTLFLSIFLSKLLEKKPKIPHSEELNCTPFVRQV